MKLNEIGELGLIERIKKKIDIRDPHIIAGIGDDTAVIESPGIFSDLSGGIVFKYGDSIPGEVSTPFALALSVSSLKRKSVLSDPSYLITPSRDSSHSFVSAGSGS